MQKGRGYDVDALKKLFRPERVAAFVLAAAMTLALVPGFSSSALKSYSDHNVRVGLAYGSSGKSAATLQVASGTGTGFQAGWINPTTDKFKGYFTVSSTKITVVRSSGNYYPAGGTYLSDGADQSACVGRWHVEIVQNWEDQKTLKAKTAEAGSVTGYYAYPAYTSGGYTVRLGRFTSKAAAQSALEDVSASLASSDSFAGLTAKVVAGGGNGYFILNYGTRDVLFEWDGSTQELAVKAVGGDAPQTYFASPAYGARRYYGVMDFVKSSDTVFSVVNVLPLGLYVRGVVPYELNPGWPEESLEAMAVIASTFALYNEGRHSSYGFDVCTGQHCQVYEGIGSESLISETDTVVSCCDAVDGMLITYDKKPIQAVYHSTNGGFTEDCENVWEAALPYLRSVKETFEQTTIGATAAQNGVWVKELTAARLTAKLQSKGYSIGTVTGVEVSARTAAGSALTLSITDGTRTINLSKENMRMVLGTDILLSQNFSVYRKGSVFVNDGTELTAGLNGAYVINGAGQKIPLPESARTALTAEGQEVVRATEPVGEPTWVFDGAGWGHSLGLCQWGSYGMAKAGWTFDQIIKYYYTGVEISGFDY